MRVAAALQAKGGDEFAKPGSIVEVKFVKGQSLSLTASRLLALMILTAGGDAGRTARTRCERRIFAAATRAMSASRICSRNCIARFCGR
jgi:hypothetical protein